MNSHKTVAIPFKRSKTDGIARLNMQGHDIFWSLHVKYLGVTLNNQLTFSKHAKNIVVKATKVRGTLTTS